MLSKHSTTELHSSHHVFLVLELMYPLNIRMEGPAEITNLIYYYKV
jgi:hypothetical protein